MWEFLLYRVAQWASLCLPLKVSYFIAERLGDGHFLFSHKDRASVLQNLRVICGKIEREELQEKGRKVFHNFGRYLVEFLRFPKWTRSFFIENVAVEGRDHLDAALARGKGAIVVSAHLGSWEVGAAQLSLLEYRVHAVVLPHPNVSVNRLFVQMRRQKGIQVVATGESVWKLLGCLSRNEILLMVGDRDFSENGIEIGFFDRPAIFPKGPAALALRSGSPLIVAFLVRDPGGRLRLLLKPPIFPKESGPFTENVRALTQEVAHLFEKQIQKDPSQWLIFKSFWNSRTVES